MMKSAIAVCIVLVVSLACQTEAQPPISELTRLSDVVHQVQRHPFRREPRNLLFDSVIRLKYSNDENKKTKIDDVLFASLLSTADAIRRKIKYMDMKVINAMGSEIEKTEAAECKNIYLNWRRIGSELWHCLYLYHFDAEADFELHKKILNETEHVILRAEEYHRAFGNCINTNDSFRCRWVVLRALFFHVVNSGRFDSYEGSTLHLAEQRKKISRQGSNVDGFFGQAKTTLSKTKDCVNKLKARQSYSNVKK